MFYKFLLLVKFSCHTNTIFETHNVISNINKQTNNYFYLFVYLFLLHDNLDSQGVSFGTNRVFLCALPNINNKVVTL